MSGPYGSHLFWLRPWFPHYPMLDENENLGSQVVSKTSLLIFIFLCNVNLGVPFIRK